MVKYFTHLQMMNDPENNSCEAEEAFQNLNQEQTRDSEIGYDDPFHCLSDLYETLKEPIPEKLTAKYLTDAAQQLIDSLNAKRKNDTQLIQKFRHALESQTQQMVQELEHQLLQVYETQSAQVDEKLKELFTYLDSIATTEVDLENFKGSLKKLFQELDD